MGSHNQCLHNNACLCAVMVLTSSLPVGLSDYQTANQSIDRSVKASDESRKRIRDGSSEQAVVIYLLILDTAR